MYYEWDQAQPIPHSPPAPSFRCGLCPRPAWREYRLHGHSIGLGPLAQAPATRRSTEAVPRRSQEGILFLLGSLETKGCTSEPPVENSDISILPTLELPETAAVRPLAFLRSLDLVLPEAGLDSTAREAECLPTALPVCVGFPSPWV